MHDDAQAGMRARALLLLAATLLLSACASEASRQKAVLAQIVKALPGRYDNLTQVQAEAGSGAHLSASLLILPLQAAVLGSDVLYVREGSASDARRVLSQRIWSFVQDKKGRVLQMNYVFKEPQRWQRAAEQPELLQALTPDDLVYLTGCELIWTSRAGGFDANATAASCRPGTSSTGLLVELQASLAGSELSLSEQQVGDSGGALTAGASPYRFDRHAN